MTPIGVPFEQGAVGTKGAATGNPITVPGIRAGNKLLAVVKHDANQGIIAGLDVSAFVVSNGQIQSASVNTAGFNLSIVWTMHA
jgi:hypothetical protein